jgi:hypothetical protein
LPDFFTDYCWFNAQGPEANQRAVMDLIFRSSGLLPLLTPHRIANCSPELVALTGRAGQRKPVQIPGLQHHSDVKSRVVALNGAAAQTGAIFSVAMIG